jgi:hypothetical protein
MPGSGTAVDQGWREITDDEAGFFQENGWVKLDGLISEDGAHALLARVKRKMGPNAEVVHHPDPTRPGYEQGYRVYTPLSVDLLTGNSTDELLYELAHGGGLGRAAEKLTGEPFRFWMDQSAVKFPDSSDVAGRSETQWHVDLGASNNSPLVPAHGQIQLWLALNDVPPERGSLRFIAPRDDCDEVREILEQPLLESYTALERRGVLSPPLHFRPGDASFHASNTLHSGPLNVTDEPRWAILVSLIPANRVFSGVHWWITDGLDDLAPGQPFPDHRFPVLGLAPDGTQAR